MLKLTLLIAIISLSACTFGSKETPKDTIKSSTWPVEGSLVPAKLWSNPSASPAATGPINNTPGILK